VIKRTITSLIPRARKSRLLSSAMIGVVLLVVAGTVGSADVAPTTFFGCLTAGGTLNKITTDPNNPPDCKGNSTEVSWNQVGPPGAPGPQGPAGPQGPQGQTGATGPQGQTGATGPQGQTGATGPQGQTGPAGADGAVGPAGPAGPAGPVGADGAAGPAGPAGPAGADGAAGPAGPGGPAGPAGPAGAGLGNPGFTTNDISAPIDNTVQALGSDGFPVVAGTDNSASSIRGIWVVHCSDVTCSAKQENHVYTVGHTFLTKVSIAIGSTGFPLLAFADSNLIMLACTDASCSTHFERAIDSAVTLSTQGVRPVSIAVGTDGFPLITYVLSDGKVRVAHCSSADCLSGSTQVTAIGSALLGPGIVDTSVAIGVDGLGVMAFGGGGITALRCSTVDCTTQTNAVICVGCQNSTNPPFDSVSVAIGADGYPLIGYRTGGARQAAELIHCPQVNCNGATAATVEFADGVNLGGYSWVTAGVNGHALMTYRDATNSLLRAAYCVDFACSTFHLTTVDTTNTEFSSVLTGVDGLPFVVAQSSATGQTKAFHCSNVFCVPYVRNR
jgi:Collagen triple helix repeat (20 copies)